MKLKALSNNIIFRFCDPTVNGKFVNSGSGVIVLSLGAGQQSGVPRWGEVLAIGPDVLPDIKIGSYICIEDGKWTSYLVFEKQKYWSTKDEFVMMIDDSIHYFEM